MNTSYTTTKNKKENKIMSEYMFYTTEDIKNYYSKKYMDKASVTPITHRNTYISLHIGNEDYTSVTADEFAKEISKLDAACGLIDDDGVFIFKSVEDKDNYIKTHIGA